MEIIVYTTPTCPWCKSLKTWLRRKRLKFEERDTTEESKFRDELIEKTGQMIIPVTEINGEIFIGFNRGVIEKALEKAKTEDQESLHQS